VTRDRSGAQTGNDGSHVCIHDHFGYTITAGPVTIGMEHNVLMLACAVDVEAALISCHQSSSTCIGEVVQLDSVRYAMQWSRGQGLVCVNVRGWVGFHDQLSTVGSVFHL
jgi:hypothetical protein